MTDPFPFQMWLSESEREHLIVVLAADRAYEVSMTLLRRLLAIQKEPATVTVPPELAGAPPSPARVPAAPGPSPTTKVGPPVPAAPALRDRWAHNRDGSEVCATDRDLESVTVEISSVQTNETGNGRRMVVRYPNGAGRGFSQASCWDPTLFPFLANRVKQRTLLYVRRAKGKYLNIMGVQA